MPSVTTPGLSTAPTGVTSFVPSLRVIALLDGSTFSIRPSTGVLRFGAGVVPPGGRRAPPGRWRDLRLGERRGHKGRRGQHRDEQRERVHVSNPHVKRVALSSDYLRTTK